MSKNDRGCAIRIITVREPYQQINKFLERVDGHYRRSEQIDILLLLVTMCMLTFSDQTLLTVSVLPKVTVHEKFSCKCYKNFRLQFLTRKDIVHLLSRISMVRFYMSVCIWAMVVGKWECLLYVRVGLRARIFMLYAIQVYQYMPFENWFWVQACILQHIVWLGYAALCVPKDIFKGILNVATQFRHRSFLLPYSARSFLTFHPDSSRHQCFWSVLERDVISYALILVNGNHRRIMPVAMWRQHSKQ